MKVESISIKDDLVIRRMILAPGEATPWHTDLCDRLSVIVSGSQITIEYQASEETQVFPVHPGIAGWDAPDARVHRAINTGHETYEEVVTFYRNSPNIEPQPQAPQPQVPQPQVPQPPSKNDATISSPSPLLPVSLREVTADTVRAITDLDVAPEQAHFVASNAISLAEALFAPEAWYRAIYHEEIPVGFVMLYDETLRSPPSTAPQVWLWRFMIDARYQRQGIGTAALEQIIDHVRAKGTVSSLFLSYVPEPGNAAEFYQRYGFQPTGEIEDGEVVLALRLQPHSL